MKQYFVNKGNGIMMWPSTLGHNSLLSTCTYFVFWQCSLSLENNTFQRFFSFHKLRALFRQTDAGFPLLSKNCFPSLFQKFVHYPDHFKGFFLSEIIAIFWQSKKFAPIYVGKSMHFCWKILFHLKRKTTKKTREKTFAIFFCGHSFFVLFPLIF